MSTMTKVRSWKVYSIAGIGITVMLFEIFKRLYIMIFY